MSGITKKKRRDEAVVSAFFIRQKRFREHLLAHPAAQKKPRLFALGFILSDMFDWENFDCHPSRETLAEKLGVTVTQVSTLTKELAHLGFIQVKRRRNTSAIYVGTTPQEVNSTSLPDALKADANDDQEVKSSAFRKSSAVDFGKSSAVDPNVSRDVAFNEGGGALHAPAADTVNSNEFTCHYTASGHDTLCEGWEPDHTEDICADPTLEAPVAASSDPFGNLDDNTPLPARPVHEVDAVIRRIVGSIRLEPALHRQLRKYVVEGALTRAKANKILSLGTMEGSNARSA